MRDIVLGATSTLVLLLCVLVTPVKASPEVVDPRCTLEVFVKDLDGPFGLAFDKNGDLYVANEGKGGGGGTTISRIARDGQVSLYATGFAGPAGLAFDEKGNLWVSDDRSPIGIWTVGTDGSVAPGSYFEFGNPNAIAFDKDWNLFVAAESSGYIYKISPNGTVTTFAGPFAGPQAVTFDEVGNVYTSDYSGTIYKIDPLGSVGVFSTGVLGTTYGGLAIDSAGNLYASEAGGEGLLSVYVFNPSGEAKPFISGFEPAGYNFLRGLIFDDVGRLYVTEYGAGVVWRVRSGPFAEFECSPESPTANEQMTFNASASHSKGGNITSYGWDFNDGNNVTKAEPVVNHTYGHPGKYNVTLKVTDEDSRYDTTSEMVTVYYVADLNRDEKVDILDIFRVAMAFESKPGDENWNATADMNKDGTVNILDIFAVAWDFGKTV